MPTPSKASLVFALLLVLLLAGILVLFAGLPAWAGLPLSLGAGLGLVALGLRAEGRLRRLESSIEAAAAGRKAIERNAADLLALFREGRLQQTEQAEGLLGNIGRAAEISGLIRQVGGRVDSFDGDFHGVGEALRDLGALVERLGAHATRLASAAEQSAAASEEMAASIEHMSGEAGRRLETVSGLRGLSLQGREEMRRNVEAIEGVVSAVGSLQGLLAGIDDIASRTSLLAMNAAIQAAHAGAAGRGFAVVAQEVRKLAISSADTARSIGEGLRSLASSIELARQGSESSFRIFADLEGGVVGAADSFLEIRRGSAELATSGREIREAVGSLKTVSLGLRDAMGDAAATMRSLEERFSHLSAESALIDEELGRAGESGSEINLHSLSTAQLEIAALKLSDRMLGLTDEAERESFLGLILKLQHLAWIARVRAAIDGKVAVESRVARDHGACDLGRWLSEGGRESIGDPELRRRLEAEHEAMHELAGSLIDRAAGADPVEGEALMLQLRRKSEAIVRLVDRIFAGGPRKAA